MSRNTTTLSPAEVAALGAHHAEREGAQDYDAVMATLGQNPVYEYPMIGKKFSGYDKAARYYTWFFANFSPHVAGTELINTWTNETSVTQEYDVTLSFDGQEERHRILGILFVEGDKLGGERVFATEQAVRRMIGPLFDEMEPEALLLLRINLD